MINSWAYSVNYAIFDEIHSDKIIFPSFSVEIHKDDLKHNKKREEASFKQYFPERLESKREKKKMIN